MNEFDEAKLEMANMKAMEDVTDAARDALESQWELVKVGKCTPEEAATVVAAVIMDVARKYFRTMNKEE